MPIVGHQIFRLWASGSVIAPMTLIFDPPANIVAQASLHSTAGPGVHKVGIMNFRVRPIGDAPEVETSFGDWTKWPSTVAAQRITRVQFGVASGTEQELEGIANIFWWS